MTAMWSGVFGARRVALSGTADFAWVVVEASATRLHYFAKRTQLSSTKSTNAFHVPPHVAAMGYVFAKRTNLAFHNEINDASQSVALGSLPRHSGGTKPIFSNRIEGARLRVHPQVDITPFRRNELIWGVPMKSRRHIP
jgi:hypothetical protein